MYRTRLIILVAGRRNHETGESFIISTICNFSSPPLPQLYVYLYLYLYLYLCLCLIIFCCTWVFIKLAKALYPPKYLPSTTTNQNVFHLKDPQFYLWLETGEELEEIFIRILMCVFCISSSSSAVEEVGGRIARSREGRLSWHSQDLSKSAPRSPSLTSGRPLWSPPISPLTHQTSITSKLRQGQWCPGQREQCVNSSWPTPVRPRPRTKTSTQNKNHEICL